jgi:serine/threonine protein kinase
MATRRRKAVRRTRKYRGGKVIGQGGTAIVIDPPIQCKDGRDMSKYVTRVSKTGNVHDLVSKNHKGLIEKLKEIDRDQRYFYYPEYCEPGALNQDNKLDGITYTNKKYSEIILKGSDVWNPITNETRSWQGFLKGKAKGKKTKMTSKNDAQLAHLKKAVELLHKNGITHNDLHGRNVIISAEDDLPRIIDFESAVLNSSDKKIEEEKTYFEDAFPFLDPEWRKSR